MRGKGAPKVVLITDGGDVNDTLALLLTALRALQGDLELKGIITCGDQPTKRAAAAREWLRQMGIADSQVVVEHGNAASDLLISLARLYKRELHVLVLAPLTALAAAVRADREGALAGLGGMYMQGVAEVDPALGTLHASPDATNMREDMDAAKEVFERLQATVPIHLMGMHTAFACALTKSDFAQWDRKLGEGARVAEETPLSLTAAVRHNLDKLRLQNPQLFYEVCEVPVERRNEHEWFDDMHELAVPYNCLTVMRLLHPELFDAAWQGRHSQCGHEQGVSSLHNAVFTHHLLTESLHAAMCTIVDTRETLKVLLVTDIGRDLDDALALLALLPYCRAGDCQLVGVVACGGHSKARAAIARGWLRALGVPDVDVMVAACNPKGRRGTVYPHGFPEAADAALTDNAGEAIVRLVQRHGGALRVVVVGPLTPLAEALAADKDNVMRTLGGLYLQGHPELYGSGHNVMLKPSVDVLTVKEDLNSAMEVFEELQAHVPFHFVGRAAGAPLQLTPTHFMQWDSMLRKAGGGAAPRKGSTGPPPLRMTALMHESLQLLHSTQPAVAYQRYGVPVEHQNPQQWLAAVKHLPVLQDAAAVLRLVAPEYFAPRWYGRHSVCGGHREWLNEDDVDAEAASNLVSLADTTAVLVELCTQGVQLAVDVLKLPPASTAAAKPMRTSAPWGSPVAAAAAAMSPLPNPRTPIVPAAAAEAAARRDTNKDPHAGTRRALFGDGGVHDAATTQSSAAAAAAAADPEAKRQGKLTLLSKQPTTTTGARWARRRRSRRWASRLVPTHALALLSSAAATTRNAVTSAALRTRQVALASTWGRTAQRHWRGCVWQVAHAAKRLTPALLALRVVKRMLLPQL